MTIYLDQETIKELLNYNPKTGVWTWMKVKNRKDLSDNVAGHINSWGYRVIRIFGKDYRSSRLVWLYMTGNWPPTTIDHIDRNKSNDCWSNLRICSSSENLCNREIFNNNTSGYRGVMWNKQRKKWQSFISTNGKKIYLGLFSNKEDAIKKRKEAELLYHKNFAANHSDK